MRELKFRAWDKAKKKMLFNVSPFVIDVWGSNESLFAEPHKRENCIFEQYTGLKDKNGKEIYEGDIVKRFKPHEFLKGVVETEVFRIRWGVKKAGFFAYNKTRKRHSQPAKRLNANDVYEIIGNIHENPELIGKEDK